MDGNELAARFVASTRWNVLPDPVKGKIRMCLLDDVVATLAGTLTQVSKITADYAVEAWRGD